MNTADICILPLALWQEFGSIITDLAADLKHNNCNVSSAQANVAELQRIFDKVTTTAINKNKHSPLKNIKDNEATPDQSSNTRQHETKTHDRNTQNFAPKPQQSHAEAQTQVIFSSIIFYMHYMQQFVK